jgi:hypothetical protein
MYTEDAEAWEHHLQLVQNERERLKDTGFVTDTSKYPWIEEGEEPVSTTTKSRGEIIREVQDYCADLHQAQVAADEKFGKVDGLAWTTKDGEHVASLLNQDPDPWGLFAYMDEKTGAGDVGYRTKDGREWFHILRQMRNKVGSGLFENLRGDSVG